MLISCVECASAVSLARRLARAGEAVEAPVARANVCACAPGSAEVALAYGGDDPAAAAAGGGGGGGGGGGFLARKMKKKLKRKSLHAKVAALDMSDVRVKNAPGYDARLQYEESKANASGFFFGGFVRADFGGLSEKNAQRALKIAGEKKLPPPDMAAAGAVTVLGESLLTLEAIQKRFVAPRVPWFAVPRIEKGGKEAKLTMDLAAAFQPWDALKNSKIWQPRTEESDARNVVDTPNILAAAFEKDWFYVRPKVCRFVKDEKQLDGVKACMKASFAALRAIFLHYKTIGEIDQSFYITGRGYKQLCKDAGLEKVPGISAAQLDAVFVATNVEINAPEFEGLNDKNQDNAIERFEFLEAVLRLALLLYKGLAKRMAPAAVLQKFLDDKLLPKCSFVEPNTFRTEQLYNEEVEVSLEPELENLRAIHADFATASRGTKGLPMLSMKEYVALLTEGNFIDEGGGGARGRRGAAAARKGKGGAAAGGFGLQEAKLAFVQSKLISRDEMKGDRHELLSFIDFVEVLGRAALVKVMPDTGLASAQDPRALGDKMAALAKALIAGIFSNERRKHLRSKLRGAGQLLGALAAFGKKGKKKKGLKSALKGMKKKRGAK